MPKDEGKSGSRGYTRRSFIGKFSLGLAGLAGAGFLMRHFLFSGGKGGLDSEGEFPGDESIFHPREDPRLDQRRRT